MKKSAVIGLNSPCIASGEGTRTAEQRSGRRRQERYYHKLESNFVLKNTLSGMIYAAFNDRQGDLRNTHMACLHTEPGKQAPGLQKKNATQVYVHSSGSERWKVEGKGSNVHPFTNSSQICA